MASKLMSAALISAALATAIVEGAGHYPPTEMPDRVAPRLLSFIGNLYGK
jgi:hypothetical protein